MIKIQINEEWGPNYNMPGILYYLYVRVIDTGFVKLIVYALVIIYLNFNVRNRVVSLPNVSVTT